MKFKILIKVFLGLVVILTASQGKIYGQNLLDLTGWTVGTGSTGAFVRNGGADENTRAWGLGPDGKSAILWTAIPSGDANADGGFASQQFPILHTSMYRFTSWVKKTNSHGGNTYLGCGPLLNLNGTTAANAYFWAGDVPELNRWSLMVGYIHASDDASTTNFGGLYDGVTGAKVANFTDFKFATTTVTSVHRNYLYYDANVNDRQYMYAPRVDLVNGDEPSLSSLLGIQSSISDPAYFAGKVGIKTTNPGAFDLAVNGNVRAREIKVDAEVWPDFVFAKDYELPSLKKTEKHIKEKGHLPGMPSATEAKAKGIELGDMNKRLLQKIEELTLHLIEMKKEADVMRLTFQEEIKDLKTKIK